MKKGRNKWQTARMMSGLTQAALAEAINYDESSVRRVESGSQEPTRQMEALWVQATGQAWLTEMDEPPGIPAVEMLGLDCEISDVLALFPDVKRMLADGKIDEDEKPLRDRFVGKVKDMGEAAKRAACAM